MAKRLFVGSLPYTTTNEQLQELFSQVGAVESVNVIVDKYTGQGKGFGFVEMASEEDAKKAIEKFQGYNFNGRTLVVNEARPREDRGFGGGGGGGGYRGGGDRKGFNSRRRSY